MMTFHAHVYYDWEHRDEALELRRRLLEICGEPIRIYGMVDKLVGPHLLPMFEVDFDESDYEALTGWLEANHGNLPVLVHPNTPDEIANHGTLARWIGRQLPINWARLGLAA